MHIYSSKSLLQGRGHQPQIGLVSTLTAGLTASEYALAHFTPTVVSQSLYPRSLSQSHPPQPSLSLSVSHLPQPLSVSPPTTRANQPDFGSLTQSFQNITTQIGLIADLPPVHDRLESQTRHDQVVWGLQALHNRHEEVMRSLQGLNNRVNVMN